MDLDDNFDLEDEGGNVCQDKNEIIMNFIKRNQKKVRKKLLSEIVFCYDGIPVKKGKKDYDYLINFKLS